MNIAAVLAGTAETLSLSQQDLHDQADQPHVVWDVKLPRTHDTPYRFLFRGQDTKGMLFHHNQNRSHTAATQKSMFWILYPSRRHTSVIRALHSRDT
jgi:hypothetical protein